MDIDSNNSDDAVLRCLYRSARLRPRARRSQLLTTNRTLKRDSAIPETSRTTYAVQAVVRLTAYTTPLILHYRSRTATNAIRAIARSTGARSVASVSPVWRQHTNTTNTNRARASMSTDPEIAACPLAPGRRQRDWRVTDTGAVRSFARACLAQKPGGQSRETDCQDGLTGRCAGASSGQDSLDRALDQAVAAGRVERTSGSTPAASRIASLFHLFRWLKPYPPEQVEQVQQVHTLVPTFSN